MNIAIDERRRSVRGYAAYPATVYDQQGCVLARGQTSNICEKGVQVVATRCECPSDVEEVILEITIPSVTPRRGGRAEFRTVRYLTKVARIEMLGQMLALGLEFVKKLD